MGWDEKSYKIERLEQHPFNCGCYFALIGIYKDYGGGPLKLKEKYYAEVRRLIDGVVEFTISPLDSLQTLFQKAPVAFTKAELRKDIKEYFKSIGYYEQAKKKRS